MNICKGLESFYKLGLSNLARLIEILCHIFSYVGLFLFAQIGLDADRVSEDRFVVELFEELLRISF